MENGKLGTGSTNGKAMDRDKAAQYTLNGIIDAACKMSHLVQSGRRISKDEMVEVAREVRGPGGFIN